MNRKNKYLLRTTGRIPNVKLSYRERMDNFELALTKVFEETHCPVTVKFTNGMYIRHIFMKAGTMISSKIHKTQHPFVITKGAVSVKLNDGSWKILEAGYHGITEPGTHRILFNHFDTVWTTYHPNPDNCQDIDELESRIIEKHVNPLLKNKKEDLCLT